MQNEINKNELQKFNRNGAIFGLLLVILVVSAVPLAAFLEHYGLVITGILFVSSMYFALKVEKFKKSNDIQTYKEIISFTEGKRLDEIEKAQELGKRPYQKVILAFACGLIAFMVCILFIWLFKSFIF